MRPGTLQPNFDSPTAWAGDRDGSGARLHLEDRGPSAVPDLDALRVELHGHDPAAVAPDDAPSTHG